MTYEQTVNLVYKGQIIRSCSINTFRHSRIQASWKKMYPKHKWAECELQYEDGSPYIKPIAPLKENTIKEKQSKLRKSVAIGNGSITGLK